MEVTTYTLHPDTTEEDLRYLTDGGRRRPQMYPQPDVLLRRCGRSHGRRPDICRLHARNFRQRTTPSRRPSPRRWRRAPSSAAPRCTPRWSRARSRASEPESCTQLILQARIRPRGLRALRARLFRLLPRSADPARSGRRRAGHTRRWPNGVWEANAHLKR